MIVVRISNCGMIQRKKRKKNKQTNKSDNNQRLPSGDNNNNLISNLGSLFNFGFLQKEIVRQIQGYQFFVFYLSVSWFYVRIPFTSYHTGI